jgi:hypothetical protein
MTASRDPDRLIHAFLDEGLIDLPDRTYDVVRSEIDRTRQRVVFGPWRTPDMNLFARLATLAGAVVVVAVVGYNLLPASSGVGVGPGVSPSPSPSPTAPPDPSPSPTVVFPPAGELAIGQHAMTLDGVPFTFSVSKSGWMSNGSFAIDKSVPDPEGASFIFWGDSPIGVFADPCAELKGPPIGQSTADLAAAVAKVPGTDLVSGPLDVKVGGYPAKYVAVMIREDVDCAAENFYLWYAPQPDLARYATQLGSTIRVWIIDVDGTPVWIDGETYKGAGPEPEQDIQQIIDSIRFE